jgi:anti-anti-sigma regulatory factor
MIRIVHLRDFRVAYVMGSLDPAAIELMADQLSEVAQYPRGLIASLEDADTIGTAGLKCLLDMQRALGNKFCLVCPRDAPAQPLLQMLTEMSSVKIFESVEYAALELRTRC